ncbi:MAG: hypothetical protein R3C25_01030 [Hyphomonadaceae bacterium]
MTFVLRWPAILVLLALVLASFAAAFAGAAHLAQLPVDLPLSPEQQETLGRVSWLEVGLWGGAGLFFLIAAIRLIRRTQAFWTWLIGFALYGGRWAVAQQSEGGLVATVQGINPSAYTQPGVLAQTPEAPEAQVGMLGVILIVGVLIFIIDAADRAYWDRQGA